MQIALRTQQVIAYETGVADVIDPLAGSYYVEKLTDRIEAEAMKYLDRIDDIGGALRAIESGFQQREIQEASYRYQMSVDNGHRTVVGVNEFRTDEEEAPEILRVRAEVVTPPGRAPEPRPRGARQREGGAPLEAARRRRPVRRQPHACVHRVRRELRHDRRDLRRPAWRLRRFSTNTTSSRDMPHMSDAERDAFLSGRRYGILTTLRADGAPVSVPVWYEWDGAALRMFC